MSTTTTSANSATYNIYNYDTGVTQFTPDGRILQVEYAAESTVHAHTKTLVALPVMTKEEGEYAIIMAVSYNSFEGGNQQQQHDNSNNVVALPMQKRIVPLSIPRIAIGMSGILPDCVSLLQEVRSYLRDWQKSYGVCTTVLSSITTTNFDDEADDGLNDEHQQHPFLNKNYLQASGMNAYRVASVIGDACQKHSFGGGIRPFGAAMLVCSVDRDGLGYEICSTDPSGAVMQWKNIKLGHCVTVGGPFASQKRIQNSIETNISRVRTENGDHVYLRDGLEAVLSSLLFSTDDNKQSNHKMFAKKGLLPEIVVVTSRSTVSRIDDEIIKNILDEMAARKAAKDENSC